MFFVFRIWVIMCMNSLIKISVLILDLKDKKLYMFE